MDEMKWNNNNKNNNNNNNIIMVMIQAVIRVVMWFNCIELKWIELISFIWKVLSLE